MFKWLYYETIYKKKSYVGFYKFKYNLGAWKVKIAEIEDDLYIVDYIYAGQENSNIKNIIEKKVNINNIIEFLQW